MSFLQIPGNIKQQFLPFVLNPKSELHQGGVSSSSDFNGKNIAPQYFTYKNKSEKYSSGYGKLNFYPSSLNSWQIADDISYKLLYAKDYPGGGETLTQRSITADDILNAIPGIQIREFLPDTRLDQCINFFKDLIAAASTLFKKDSSTSGDKNQSGTVDVRRLMKQIVDVSTFAIQYMTGTTKENFYTDLQLSANTDLPFSSYKSDIYDNSPGNYVIKFPYILYYRLQSCVTTNIYEIPAIPTNKQILYSDGTAGWGTGSDIMSKGGFRISDMLGKLPGVGILTNMMLGNIGVNYMPWWDAPSGARTVMPDIEITFDLFNDTANAALMNFIFVNTIVPNNMWVQYNMFQHSSSIYDIKIEGINRLFACSGNFNVTYEGVLRDPPIDWYWKLRPYFNKNMSSTFEENIKNNKMIKIPDIYRVKMVFKSLLPANFNNFIFNFSENASHITKYSNHVYDQNILTDKLPNAINNFLQAAAEKFKASGKEYDDNKNNSK